MPRRRLLVPLLVAGVLTAGCGVERRDSGAVVAPTPAPATTSPTTDSSTTEPERTTTTADDSTTTSGGRTTTTEGRTTTTASGTEPVATTAVRFRKAIAPANCANTPLTAAWERLGDTATWDQITTTITPLLRAQIAAIPTTTDRLATGPWPATLERQFPGLITYFDEVRAAAEEQVAAPNLATFNAVVYPSAPPQSATIRAALGLPAAEGDTTDWCGLG